MTKKTQSLAHDHVAKFLEEEFDRNVRGVHVNASSMLRAYDRWCEARNIVNRKLTALSLLDQLEHRFNIKLENIFYQGADFCRQVHAFRGLRFKADGLNARLSTGSYSAAAATVMEIQGRQSRTRLKDDE